MIQIVGTIAGICTSISLLPQLIKLIREKKSEDISLVYLIVLLTGLAFWVWYGFLRDDIPLIVFNSFSLMLNVSIVILGIRYKGRHGKHSQR